MASERASNKTYISNFTLSLILETIRARIMFRTSFTYTYTTPLPPRTRKSDALALLHDPPAIISLSPLTQSHRRIDSLNDPVESPNPSLDGKSSYEITHAVPVLPFHLWDKSVTFKADFDPVEDGTDVVVYAPGDLIIISEWRTRGEDGGEMVLEEKAEVKCSVFVLPLVKPTHAKSHHEVHMAFLERLKEKEKERKTGE